MSDEAMASVPRGRGSAEFVESAVLETLVPESTDVDIEHELSELDKLEDDGDASPLSRIAQRRLLYFGEPRWRCGLGQRLTHARLTDERLVVYVILRIPYQDEDILTSYLSRLAIALDAYAGNLHPAR